MADDEVRIDTRLDTSGLDKGLKDMQGKLDKAGKNINKASTTTQKFGTVLNEASGSAGGFANKLSGAAAAGGPYVAAAVAAIAVTKKIGETMRDCTETYKVQERAELALTAAAQNNPYINEESVEALKKYASELQKISNIGDETSIKLMAQLVSAGRTQEEIQKIMAAAADYAAATETDIKTAVQTLNMTYSGMSGTLGRQISDIKDLSAEELAHGKAIDIVAAKYKGMASALADTATQAVNAKGDYKEALGELFKPTVNAWDKWWQGFYEKGVERVNAINELLENASRKWNFGGIKRSVDEGVDAIMTTYTNKITGETRGGEKLQTTEYLKWLEKELQLRGELNSKEQNALLYVSAEIKYRERVAKYEEEQAEAERRRAAALAEQEKSRKTADDYARKSNEALDAELAKLEIEAKAKGTAVSAQDKYNVVLKNYVALLTETEGKIKEGYPVEQKRLQQLQEAKKALDEATDAEKKLQAAIDATNAVLKTMQEMEIIPTASNALAQQIEQYKQIREQIAAMSEEQIEAAQADAEIIYTKEQLLDGLKKNEIELEKQKVAEKTALDKSYYDEYAEQQQALLDLKKSIDESEVLSEEEKEKQKADIDKKYAQNKAQLWNEVLQEINGYTQQAAQIAQEAGDLMLKNVQTETDLELAKLEEKYEKGEISEEEYYEKQKAIKRKAAQEEYKIQMFQWTASILAATANIAEGVSKAIAQGGTAGLITGALVGAAGAVQIASIIASKPVPPQFYAGGIIGGANGATMGSDNTYIHARTGVVLNAHQQRSLWDMINGQDSREQAGLNLTVNNTQAGRVDTDIREQDGELFIDILDKHINKGFTDGTYDAGLAAMNTRQEGVRIL